jgi:hypothetical protein
VIDGYYNANCLSTGRDTIMDVIKHCSFQNLPKDEVVVRQGERGDE